MGDVANSEEVKLIEQQSEKQLTKLDLVKILAEVFELENEVNKLQLELKLKESNINFIKFMMKNFPESLKDISSKLDIVLEDGKLDLTDVPILVSLVKDIVKNKSKTINKLKKVTVEELIDFIRNILEILIHKNYIHVEDKDKVFKLIFVSVELLNTTIDVSEDLTTIFDGCCWK